MPQIGYVNQCPRGKLTHFKLTCMISFSYSQTRLGLVTRLSGWDQRLGLLAQISDIYQWKARRGEARQGKARQGKARQGKAMLLHGLDCDLDRWQRRTIPWPCKALTLAFGSPVGKSSSLVDVTCHRSSCLARSAESGPPECLAAGMACSLPGEGM